MTPEMQMLIQQMADRIEKIEKKVDDLNNYAPRYTGRKQARFICSS